MDNEMIEKVAKALWENYQKQPYVIYGISNSLLFGDEFAGKPVPWEYVNSSEVVPHIVNEYRNDAKIAIKAMREPTEKMCYVGSMCLPDYDPDVDNAKRCWQDMIDAIINE
jgi:hypothetical protein